MERAGRAGGQGDQAGEERYESGEVLAVGRMVNGRFVAEEVGYWRIVAGPDGIMFAVAPLGGDDEPDTISADASLRAVEAVKACSRSRSRILRRLFGTRAGKAKPAESLGDLLAARL